MRANIPAYELRAPAGLGEALAWMAQEPGAWQPFAGGTDLMVLLEAGKLTHRRFLNIWKLPELRGIAATSENVTLGALTTYSEIQRHPILAAEFPLLCRAAEETGSVATQNRGTLGGNIANASPASRFSSRFARLRRGTRTRLCHRFAPRPLPRLPHRLQENAHAPRRIDRAHPPSAHETWMGAALSQNRHAQRAGHLKSLLRGRSATRGRRHPRFALRLRQRGADCCSRRRCGIGPARPATRPCRNPAARAALPRGVAPIDDIRSTARYRLRVAQNILEEFLQSLAS